MATLNTNVGLVPFPPVPAVHADTGPPGRLALMPAWRDGDCLDIDLDGKKRPHLITDLLERCTSADGGEKPGEAFFWDLSVGKRIECLLAIAVPARTQALDARLQCSNPSCREQMEIEIGAGELRELQHRADEAGPVAVAAGGRTFRLRRPTGRDQRAWLDAGYKGEAEAIVAAIRSLMLPDPADGAGPLTNEQVAAIDAAMSAADPLVSFELRVKCPGCGREQDHAVDLEGLALQKIREARRRLLDDVHRIARRYHWSEGQIVALPPWRRAYYISLIDRDDDR